MKVYIFNYYCKASIIEWIILSKDLFRDNTPIHECNIRSISEQFCYRGEMEHSKKKTTSVKVVSEWNRTLSHTLFSTFARSLKAFYS